MWKANDNNDQPLPAAQANYKQRVMTDAKERVQGFAVLAIAFVVFSFAKAIYGFIENAVDDQGWVEHSHDTPVWIGGDWLTGEYRICKMPLMPKHSLPSSAHLICGENIEQDADSWPTDFIASIPDHDFYELMGSKWEAVEQYFHVLPVNYWGRIDRRDQLMFSWGCQREASGLECKALN